jgi:hypothetical protein
LRGQNWQHDVCIKLGTLQGDKPGHAVLSIIKELWPLLQAETKRDIDGKQWEGMIAYKHKRGTEEKKRCPDQEQGQDVNELCFTV